jgi:flagellar hook protein FlgE
MLGSIYIGLSGMKAFSRGLQTISNNVANLNSPGFKAATTNFDDVYSHSGKDSTYATGSDTSASGEGVSFSASLIDFAQGELRQTDGDLDLAIDGSGFLVLLKDGNSFYTRTAEFEVDKDGYISQKGSGSRLGVLDGSGKVVELSIDADRTIAPKATTTVKLADNLSSSATTATISDVTVYDALGGKQTWTATFEKVQTAIGEWTVTVTDQDGGTVGTQSLQFIGSTVDPTTSKLSFSKAVTGSDPVSVTFDFSSGVTSFSAGTTSTLRASSVDGTGVGSISGITIDEDGQVKLTYTNEETKIRGFVAVADFRDPQELQPLGNGLYRSAGHGPTRIVSSETEGAGRVLSRQSEASNVDLSEQFGNLIMIQRGFQASSQVISVTNDMIQQLFGIRGQG